MKICEHYSGLKLEKVTNFIQNAQLSCSNTAKHVVDKGALWLCLTCGYVGCSRFKQLKCAEVHYSKQKHKLTVSLEQGNIFCYECDEMYSDIIEAIENDLPQRLLDKFEKFKQFNDKVESAVVRLQARMHQKAPSYEFEKTHKMESEPEIAKQPSKYAEEHVDVTTSKLGNKINYNVFGLNNLGNTCFFNSIMQSLYASRAFHEAYVRIDFSKPSETSSEAQRIQEMYEQVEEKYHPTNPKITVSNMSINQRFRKFLIDASKTTCFNPSDVFSSVGTAKNKFRSMAQQDAQELLRYLLDALNQGEITQLGIDRLKMKSVENKLGKQQLTYIQHMFGCYLASKLHCQSCNLISWTLDLCLDLNIEIVRDKTQESIPVTFNKEIPEGEIKCTGLSYPPKDAKIPKLLYSFFSPEVLTKQNYFHCEKCKMSKAVKKLYLKEPPRILTIVIKRFTNGLMKNNSMVEFPLEMSLQGVSLTPGEWVYRLYAVVVHQGGVGGGHYIAYTRRGESWYYFSDSHFKQTTWENVKSAQSYVLFYESAK